MGYKSLSIPSNLFDGIFSYMVGKEVVKIMKSILKRYMYKSGLDIVAPLKCGTRWLEGLDVEERTYRYDIHMDELSSHIHSGTIFIWRPVREHMLSALKTEFSLHHTEKSPFDIVTEMEAGICDHWYPHLYRELYTIWSKTPFRFHKLRALSELTPTAGKCEFTSTAYRFNLPTQWDSIESILSSLSPKHLIRLNKLIGDEDKWLKSMLKAQYIGRTWEEYSELEDSRLEMLCKSMDLKAEVELLNETLVNQLKLQRTNHLKLTKSLYDKINELNESNTKLESKVEYAESLLGRKAVKLI